MSKMNQVDLTFEEKFKGRMESIGKDGVLGIIKTSENPINEKRIDNARKGIRSILPLMDQRLGNNNHNQLLNGGMMLMNSRQVQVPYMINPNLLPIVQRNYQLLYPYLVTNNRKILDSRVLPEDTNISVSQNETYKTYSLKDYINLTRKEEKLAGLGPNIGTQEWIEKRNRMLKKGEYCAYVHYGNKNAQRKKIAPPREEHLKKIENEVISSIRYKSYQYGRKVKLKPHIQEIIKKASEVNDTGLSKPIQSKGQARLKVKLDDLRQALIRSYVGV